MPKTTPEQNKAIVLKAFDTLFNERDYAAAEHFWSPKYIQHCAHIAPGREGLFALIRSAPDTLRYENQRIVAEGLADLVAFGRPYIANPDLVQRFADNAPLAEVDWETVYASGPHGYSDYPTYQSS